MPGACLYLASGGAVTYSLFPTLDWFSLSRVVPLLARVSGLLAVTAMLVGGFALWQIRRRPGTYGGRHLAVDGIISGGVMLLCSLILISDLRGRREMILEEREIHSFTFHPGSPSPNVGPTRFSRSSVIPQGESGRADGGRCPASCEPAR